MTELVYTAAYIGWVANLLSVALLMLISFRLRAKPDPNGLAGALLSCLVPYLMVGITVYVAFDEWRQYKKSRGQT